MPLDPKIDVEVLLAAWSFERSITLIGVSAATWIDQLLMRSDASELLVRDGRVAISRDRARGLINAAASKGRSLVNEDDLRVGLMMDRSPYAPLVMLGLSLSGAEVLLLRADSTQQELYEIQRVWSINRTLKASDLITEGQLGEQKSAPSITDYGVSLESNFFTILSSGTTGNSKAITHSYSSAIGSALAFSAAMGIEPGDRFFHNWPMFYMAGLFNLFLCPLVAGAEVLLSQEFSAAIARRQLNAITDSGTNQILLSPTMANVYTRVMSAHKLDLSACKVVCTSSMLYPSVESRFTDVFNCDLHPCYGITEYGGSFTFGTSKSKPFSVGKPIQGVTVRIDSGEIKVKSPFVAPLMSLPDGRSIRLEKSKFHPTNDLGTISEDGEVFLLGRLGDEIKKGGEFLSLIDIEDIALSVSGVSDALAIPCASEFWGQDFVLKIVCDERSGDERSVLHRKLVSTISDSRSPLAVPLRIDFVPAIARTDSGKPLRRAYLGEGQED